MNDRPGINFWNSNNRKRVYLRIPQCELHIVTVIVPILMLKKHDNTSASGASGAAGKTYSQTLLRLVVVIVSRVGHGVLLSISAWYASGITHFMSCGVKIVGWSSP